MKLKKCVKLFSLIFVLSFVATTISFAQEAATTTTTTGGGQKAIEESTKNADGSYTSKVYDEADRPEDNYLAKFHAQDVVYKLIKLNLDQIYLMKVIVTNFADKGWKADYDKVYEGYKRSMELYYKRNIIYSRVEFEKNRKEIQALQKKIIDEFKKDSQIMLNECADTVLMLSLDAQTRSDPNRNEELFANQLRLKIAYGQFDDALGAEISKYYEGSIYHLRMAKSYAIKILEDIARPEEKEKVRDRFKIERADILNRVYKQSGASTGTQPAATPKAGQ
jgi:hypothetical protein